MIPADYPMTQQARRKYWISRLGGKCVRCNCANSLEFHHIDPTKKSFNVSSALSHRYAKIKKEMLKCELLCQPCHKTEHKKPNQHGTISQYQNYKCRCEKCRIAWNEYMRLFRLRAQHKTEPIHGRPATFSNHKCRCDPCRQAWNKHCREYQQRKRKEKN